MTNSGKVMKNLRYKGFQGAVRYSKEEKLFYGNIIWIKHLVSFEGRSLSKLRLDFRDAVNFYIKDCRRQNFNKLTSKTR